MERQKREYEFAGFRLSVLKRQLCNEKQEPLELPARAFDVLVFLVEHRGEDIGKGQIMKAVWPDTIVEENNLNQAIFSLRRALGDSANNARFILTLPGRGYRFIADVVEGPLVKPRRRSRSLCGSRNGSRLGTAGIILLATLAWSIWPQHDANRNAQNSLARLALQGNTPGLQSDPPLELGMTTPPSLVTIPEPSCYVTRSVASVCVLDFDLTSTACLTAVGSSTLRSISRMSLWRALSSRGEEGTESEYLAKFRHGLPV